MSPVQTNYSERMAPAVAGMVANERDYDSITRTAEGTIGFGLAIARGDVDASRGVKLAGSLPEFLGVSLRDITLPARTTNTDSYIETENVGVFTKGEIWVQVSGTPGPADPVHYNATTGVFAASGGSGPVVGARWMEVSANGLGRLFLSGNGQATS